MLTRDISLEYAILDLLDNCVDGIQRSARIRTLQKKKPYDGYWAKINISSDQFRIEDNCGGIPWSMHEYAFRMGRLKKEVDSTRRMVGTYGIGMKRAIFKIGQECTVATHSRDRSYTVRFSPEWMKDEDQWDIEATEIPKSRAMGTTVTITQLHKSIGTELGSKVFRDTLRKSVATHYAYIMQKGFAVYVNGQKVPPKKIRLLFEEATRQTAKREGIRPFIYTTTHEEVEVFLAVGFTSPIPSKEEVDDGLVNNREKYSSEGAGWTVICNDRTVLYCDKTPLTGWGVSGVPQYHTQFVAISGIVLFNAADASCLPTTTTKRGIDASSHLYMQIRDKMIEGMKLFTQYTNEWKSKEQVAESRRRLKQVDAVDLEDIRSNAAHLPLQATRGAIPGSQYRPTLPKPKKTRMKEKISFMRPVKEVRKVSSYLFGTSGEEPKKVGQKCFELILEEVGE